MFITIYVWASKVELAVYAFDYSKKMYFGYLKTVLDIIFDPLETMIFGELS